MPSPENPSRPAELSPAPASGGGSRRVKVIGREPLVELLDEAFARALEDQGDAVPASVASALRSRARGEFLRLLRRHGRRVRGFTRGEFLERLQRSRNDILLARERARTELSDLEGKVAGLRVSREQQRVERVHLQERLAVEHREKAQRTVARWMAEQRRGELDQEELERRVEGLLAETTLLERERIEADQAEREDQVRLLERRIAKLRSSLERTEVALRDLEREAGQPAGVASIFREVQGLSAGTDGRRVALLERIYELNLELQRPGAPAAESRAGVGPSPAGAGMGSGTHADPRSS